MPDFIQTPEGRRFFNVTLPTFMKVAEGVLHQLTELNKEMKLINEHLENINTQQLNLNRLVDSMRK